MNTPLRSLQASERIERKDRMSIEELIEELEKCRTGDEESDHLRADKLLLKFIDDQRVTAAFNDIEKFYA